MPPDPTPLGQQVPTFAVIGDPNDGKTTLAATLAEDDSAAIDARAGTTRVREEHVFSLRGQPVLRFIDTPGFENTPQLRAWFEEHRESPGDLAQRFIAEHSNDPRYLAECEILRAIGEAAVIFVVDGSRAINAGDRDRIEILLLCSTRRVVIINRTHGADAENLAAWRELIHRRGLTPLEFDAHHVSYADRVKLLDVFAGVMPEWHAQLKQVVRLLEEAWEGRLIDARNELLSFLEECVSLKISIGVKNPDEVEPAKSEASQKMRERLRSEEVRLRERVRAIFRHTRADWELAEVKVLREDLFSEDVWRLLGLTRSQLIWAGAMAGLAAGGAIDLMTAGHSLGLPTLLGAAAGAVGGWLLVGRSIELKTPTFYVGPVRIPAALLSDERAVVARPSLQSNLTWILLDRALWYIQAAASWSHGRREERAIPLAVDPEETRIGPTSQWENTQRKAVAEYLGLLRRGALKVPPKRLQDARAAAAQALLAALRELTAR